VSTLFRRRWFINFVLLAEEYADKIEESNAQLERIGQEIAALDSKAPQKSANKPIKKRKQKAAEDDGNAMTDSTEPLPEVTPITESITPDVANPPNPIQELMEDVPKAPE
jgi:hypothetical protein